MQVQCTCMLIQAYTCHGALSFHLPRIWRFELDRMYTHCMHNHLYTCIYLHIPYDTYTYMHIHTYTYTYPLPKTWNTHISATNDPFDTSQRTGLLTISKRQIVLVFGTFHSVTTKWLHFENCWKEPSLAHQNSENNHPISGYMDAFCSMRVEGWFVQVWACLDHPCDFYGRGKTPQNTKLLYGVHVSYTNKP